MGRRKPHGSGSFLGANPDRAGAAHQGEGIVADNLRRAFQFKLDGVVGKGPDGAEFIGHAQDDASCVGSIGDQAGVVGQKRELLIDALSGIASSDDLSCLECSPRCAGLPICEMSSASSR